MCSSEPVPQQRLQACTIEVAEPEACQRAARPGEILAADRAADREERVNQRCRHAGETRHGGEKESPMRVSSSM